VEGRRCERCRENKHDKKAGCIDCPVCYNLVQDAADELRKKLANLENLLTEIERNPSTVSDPNFDKQLDEVVVRVETLLRDANRAQGTDGSLVSQLESLRARTQKVREMAAEVRLRIPPIEAIVHQGERNISMAEEVIDQAHEALAAARRVLDTDGMGALDKARERSKRFGQQNERMTVIAHEARLLADKHEQEAVKTEELARNAIATSENAYKLALDAIQTQENNRLALRKLESQLEEIAELMLRTQKMANDSKKEASKAYTDTLSIFTDISGITVPSLESDRFRIEALDLIGQAENILREALNLLQKNAEALNNTQYHQNDAKILLSEAKRQQQIADDMLIDVTSALSRANESIHSGENTLNEARKTLTTLKEFDGLVQDSKLKAQAALEKVNEIRRLIEEAEAKTEEAENALRGALQDAIEARDIAIEAQKIAEKASEDATRIRLEADQTKTRARNLKVEADTLTTKVDETSRRMKEYEDQAANDEKLAREALERANEAKTSAFQADAKVKGALDTVTTILTDLGQFVFQ
jgi:coxsackievirus/adenovirus receptor